jgi:phytol kinase
MVGASYLVTFLVLAIASPVTVSTFLLPIPIAIVAAILEAISPGGTDNLSVPLISATLCYGLSYALNLISI